MSSSSAGRSRIIHAGSRATTPTGPARGDPGRSTAPDADAAHAAVLRGRRAPSAPEWLPGCGDDAGGLSRTPGLALSSGPSRFAGGGGGPLGADAAADLRDLQRIAEERGYAAGHSRAIAELDAAIEAAGVLALQLESIAPHETTVVAHSIAELALAIARRVVESELHIDPAMLVHAVESALGSINGSPEAHVLLHPSTVGPVRLRWEATHGPGYLGKRWTFEADPSLPAGGCILRYEHGFVDAGLEAQIEEIGIALDAAIPSFRDGPVGDESADEEAGAA